MYNAGKTPKWNDITNIDVKNIDDDMTLTVYNENEYTKSEIIGSCQIKLSLLCVEGGIDEWFAIQHEGEETGEVHLKATWKPILAKTRESTILGWLTPWMIYVLVGALSFIILVIVCCIIRTHCKEKQKQKKMELERDGFEFKEFRAMENIEPSKLIDDDTSYLERTVSPMNCKQREDDTFQVEQEDPRLMMSDQTDIRNNVTADK